MGYFFRILLLSFSGVLILSLVFATETEMENGEIVRQTYWFHTSCLIFAISVLFTEITLRKSRYTFAFPDVCFVLLSIIFLISYNWSVNPHPGSLLFGSQLIALWFMLRYAIRNEHVLRTFYLFIIAYIGMVGAIGKIILLNNSQNEVFAVIRPFVEHETFYGYLAIILPVSIHMLFRFSNCRKTDLLSMRTILYYFSWINVLLILYVIFLGRSQQAWLIAIISSVWMCWMQLINHEEVKKRFANSHKTMIASSAAALILITGVSVGIYLTHQDKAEKYFHTCNIAAKAIFESPLQGNGIGSFQSIYANKQADYFASGIANEQEKLIADCPKVASNEYLQLGVELGLIGLLLFVAWIGVAFYYGVTHKQFGACGGILAMAIFALYSYPLQLPAFWVLLIFFSAICVTDVRVREGDKYKTYPFIGALAALLSCYIFYVQKDNYKNHQEWEEAKILFRNHSYAKASNRYKALYPYLQHKTNFLLEGTICLEKTGEKEEAERWLVRALQTTPNPLLHHLYAKHKMETGCYPEAEAYLLRAIHMQPSEIYSYYLLAKLYADTSYFQPEKIKLTADQFFTYVAIRPTEETQAILSEMETIVNRLAEEE